MALRRLNRTIQLTFALLAFGLVTSLLLFIRVFNGSDRGDELSCRENNSSLVENDDSGALRRFRCLIEGTRPLQCVKQGDEVYLPFNRFLKKQFDLSGKLNKDSFEYYTSYSKVRASDETTIYDPFGPYGHFASYNVEIRERVRCINAAKAVPMSVQWDSTPYFYPIQIAQFALQHYSRYKTDSPPVIYELHSEHLQKGEEAVKNENSLVTIKNGDITKLGINNENAELTTLVFSWQPKNSQDSWFEAKIQVVKTAQNINLKYQRTDTSGYGECVWPDPEMDFDVYSEDERGKDKELSFIYSLGPSLNTSRPIDVTLDLVADATKALALLHLERKENGHPVGLKSGDIRLLGVTYHGPAEIRLPVKQQNKANRELFFRAANWLVEHQSDKGGWAIPVERVIADGRLLLKAGWHSAMAQGHALSVLVRAYNASGDTRYIDSCLKALQLFEVPASQGGVVNRLFGYDWFEEYPTEPGTFVLNGFLYSLIGLWDASSVPQLRNESLVLFHRGLDTLLHFLPLFDTGYGSIYDLRHLGLKSAPNLARWDYHSVHVYLLQWLYNITGEKQLNDVAVRWADYAHGKRAKHN